MYLWIVTRRLILEARVEIMVESRHACTWHRRLNRWQVFHALNDVVSLRDLRKLLLLID